jgi:hypothetical protein
VLESWSYHAPSLSTKTAIYLNLTTNSLILEREEGQRISAFSRKRKGKELTKGVEWWCPRWPALLEFPDRAMARRATDGRCATRMERTKKKE